MPGHKGFPASSPSKEETPVFHCKNEFTKLSPPTTPLKPFLKKHTHTARLVAGAICCRIIDLLLLPGIYWETRADNARVRNTPHVTLHFTRCTFNSRLCKLYRTVPAFLYSWSSDFASCTVPAFLYSWRYRILQSSLMKPSPRKCTENTPPPLFRSPFFHPIPCC